MGKQRRVSPLQQKIVQVAAEQPAWTHKQIAARVGCHPSTVDAHLKNAPRRGRGGGQRTAASAQTASLTTTPDTTPTQFTIVGAVDGWLAHPDTGHAMAQAWDDDRNAPQAWGEALWFSAQIWAECSLAIGVRRVEAEFLSEAKARIAGMGADLAAAEARHTAALEAASSPAEFDQAYGIRRTVADYLRHTMTTTDHAVAIAVEDVGGPFG